MEIKSVVIPNNSTRLVNPPRIINGSKLTIGSPGWKTSYIFDHHFNKFQKKMIKWCFGITVTDYKEE